MLFRSLKSGHYMTMKKLDSPYGYIGTWHTHPTQFPTPSDVDLADWKNKLQYNECVNLYHRWYRGVSGLALRFNNRLYL